MTSTPLVFGHRGASEYAPENTIRAFQLAMDQGADGIETDLRFTADDVLVCFHDNDLQRVIGRPEKISELTYEELCDLVRGSEFYGGAVVPTIDDLLAWRPAGCWMMLEQKDARLAQPERMAVLKNKLEAAGRMERLWVTSFNVEILKTARALMPEMPLMWISAEEIKLEDLWTDTYSPHYTILEQHPDLCARYHAAGKLISVWDPHPEDRIEFHLAQQTDTLTPNAPDKVVALLKQQG